MYQGPMNRYPIHYDSLSHGKLELSTWQARPMGYVELERCLAGSATPVPLDVINVRATTEAGETLDWTQNIVTLDFRPLLALGPLALVPGGWLPPVVAGGHHLLVLDRHMAGELKHAKASMDLGAPNSLLALVTDEPAQYNVLAHVFEGNARRRPTTEEIAQSTGEVYAKLRAWVPKAVLVPSEDNAAHAAEAIWNNLADSQQRASAFLTRAWPDLRPVALHRQAGVMHRMVRTARDAGVRIRSLPFLAATLAACLPPSDNPAAELFKANGKQAPDGAVYNALSDLLHLQMVVAGNAHFPDSPIAFVTNDLALARFWVGLGINSIVADENGVHFSMPLDNPATLMGHLPTGVRTLFESVSEPEGAHGS
jgi:hypothetical protein